ncbi:MAG: ribokinase [Chloroflexota bacterium]|nr:ribokinase [Chloroflexota bacterium]
MADRKTIVVVGSLNMDLVVRTARLPSPGETVRGSDFGTFPGGKGANQAVAAARVADDETRVYMVGHVGEDDFGKALRNSLRDSGVNVEQVRTVPGATGNAMIAVEESGENFIIITAGANGTLTSGDLDEVAPLLQDAEALLLQLEIPLPVVERAAQLAAEGGTGVILNPAPAPDGPLPPSLLRHVSILIVNETEAAALAGEQDPGVAAKALRTLGIPVVILTLGAEGAIVLHEGESKQVPAFAITPVDTTAAGDAFVGALAAALVEGHSLLDAVRFANGAGALAATRPGAQPSLPRRRELLEFIK